MTTKTKVLLGIMVILLSFAFGRYSVPGGSSTTTQDKQINTDIQKDKDTHTTTTTTTKKDPSGAQVTTTVTDTTTETHTTKEQQSHSSTTQTVVAQKRATLNLSALAGFDYNIKQPVYGASITKEVLGPVTIGLWGLNNKSFGASVGVSF